MAYKDFSFFFAITPTYQRRSVKIQGAANAVKIMQNPSRATEDYIQGAVTSIGAANRQILYVNSSLEALNDRLRIASKLAYAINTSKRRGTEGFNDVPMMNPWTFALEEDGSKEGGFFHRIWEAIKTICRRIIEAIAHLIKWIANAFANLDTKTQAKHYQVYKKNISKLTGEKLTEVDNTKIKAPSWKINDGEITKFIGKALGQYIKMTTASTKGKDVDALEKLGSGDPIDALSKGEGFAASILSDSEAKGAKEAVDNMLKNDINAVFGQSKNGKASELVREKFVGSDSKKEQTTCGAIRKATNEFACLEEGKLARQAKNALSVLHEHQSKFTKYTKSIDKFVDNYGKSLKKNLSKDASADDKKGLKTKLNSLQNKLSMITNSRVRYNSYWTSLMLEIQTMVLRYNKSAHVAMKFYLKALNLLDKDAKKKEKETKKKESSESLFNFF